MWAGECITKNSQHASTPVDGSSKLQEIRFLVADHRFIPSTTYEELIVPGVIEPSRTVSASSIF